MFAENLKKYRKLSGFRQGDVAEILGVDRSAYTYYENGKTEPNIESIQKIASMFRVDVNMLFGYEPEENTSPAVSAQLHNDSHFDYENNASTEELLGRCSAEERLLIAYYRICNDKKEVLEAVRKMYEASPTTTEE